MIIDSHVHIGECIDFVMTEQMVLNSMEKYHINYSLVSNADSIEYDHELKKLSKELQISQIDSLKRTLKLSKEHPDKIGVLPWIKPATEKLDEEFKKLIEDNLDLIHGIKVHPYFSKTAFDSPKIEPYIQLAEQHHFPVITHTGGCKEADPIHVYNMAVKHPMVNFVIVHMGLGTDNKEAIALMEKAENLYADTTWVPVESTLEVIKRYGSKRVIFGSDNPIEGEDMYLYNKTGETSLYQQYFHELEDKIGEESYKDIMWRNAILLFHLEGIFRNCYQ